jgi:hypothetical protein
MTAGGGLDRRRLPLLLLPLLARPAQALPPEIRFRIMREGSAIGTHRVVFSEAAGGEQVARTEVDVTVRLMGITVFRLSHRFTEAWAGGRLRLATSRYERNGQVTEMVARMAEGGILARGPEGEQRLPLEAAPLTWWDPSRFTRPLFDADTGRPLQLRWTRQALPGGGVRWRASGEDESEGSYAADGAWLGWKTRGEDGSLVTYERA